jgi:hypothetical protein
LVRSQALAIKGHDMNAPEKPKNRKVKKLTLEKQIDLLDDWMNP